MDAWSEKNQGMAFTLILILLSMVQCSLQFQKAAVATDVPLCSDMGTSILERGGSAVDAAITSMLCIGTVNPQSSSLGGGFSMVMYMDKKPDAIMSLERQPLASHPGMLDGHNNSSGGLFIAVPGQAIGLWEAHQRYGKLPWKSLFEPVINIARNGHPVTKHLERVLFHYMQDFPEILDQFRNEDGSLMKEGDTKKAITYANTLEKLANNGPWEFYMGETGKAIIKEIQEWGGVITEDDFCPGHIAPEWKTPPSSKLRNGNLTMYSSPMPSSGDILLYLMNILDEFNITKESIATYEDKVLLYHRFLEATKLAFDIKYQLGDAPDCPDVKKVLAALNCKLFAKTSAEKIQDDRIIPYSENNSDNNGIPCWRTHRSIPHHGDTSHISILAENGDAVAVTASIGFYFGCRKYSKSSGIFFNDHMATFNNLETHPNSLKPGRRLSTATAPSILLDSSNEVKMVVGSSGAFLIIPTNAWVILRTLWTGATLEEAIDEKRIYPQYNQIVMELTETAVDKDGVIGRIRESLEAIGHSISDTDSISVPQAVIKYAEGDIRAYSDFIRKGGIASGY